MRILVTGGDGFVGRHLCAFLEDRGDIVIRMHGEQPAAPSDLDVYRVDIRDGLAVREVVGQARPDAIVHLAGISSVAYSYAAPATALEVNTLGALNLCLAAKESAPVARLLLISSGEVYGTSAGTQPASEKTIPMPSSPYACSKVAAEAVSLQFARSYRMDVMCARPFSHLGAGQAPTFALPSFARQVAAARQTGARATLSVGNLEPVRDFCHVRDVVLAYRLLLERGVSGETYNVCSGHGRSVRSLLDELIELAGVQVDVHVDPSKLRPVDIPFLVGDASKLREIGWEPRSSVRDALQELLAETALSPRGT